MLQHVPTVLIGNAFKTVAPTVAGDVIIVDENKKLLATAEEAAAAKEIYIGVYDKKVKVAKPDGTEIDQDIIEYSMPIQKSSRPHLVSTPFSAVVEDQWTLDFADVTPVIGHDYTLRLIYSDIYEDPGQFTHSYQVRATTATASDLVAKLKAKINKHSNRRVVVSGEGTNLILTAMPKDDNEGKNSINYYSQVIFKPIVWKNNPTSFVQQPEAVLGSDAIEHTQTSNPGDGNAKIVRDRESAALGYKGIMNRTQFPVIMPELKVDLSKEYDTIVIENDNLYLSNDNQYIKTTPISTELYIVKGEGEKALAVLKGFVDVNGSTISNS